MLLYLYDEWIFPLYFFSFPLRAAKRKENQMAPQPIAHVVSSIPQSHPQKNTVTVQTGAIGILNPNENTQTRYRQNTGLTRDCPANGLPLPPPSARRNGVPTQSRPPRDTNAPKQGPSPSQIAVQMGQKERARDRGKTETVEHLTAAIRAG